MPKASCRALKRSNKAKGIYCEFEIDAKSQFSGEPGDLQELLGNFLENAFKWADRRVLLSARPIYEPAAKRPGLYISIEDDGKGIAPEDIGKILQRGVRGDERVDACAQRHGHRAGHHQVLPRRAGGRCVPGAGRRPFHHHDALPDLAEHAGDDPVPARHFAGPVFLDGPHLWTIQRLQCRGDFRRDGEIRFAYGRREAGADNEQARHRAMTIRMDFMAHLSFLSVCDYRCRTREKGCKKHGGALKMIDRLRLSSDFNQKKPLMNALSLESHIPVIRAPMLRRALISGARRARFP